MYRRALVRFFDQNGGEADAKLEAAQCHLNLALCLLHPKTPENSTEVVICCDAALELLQLPDQAAWRAKAYYRKGQAFELSGDLSSALDATASAAAAYAGDKVICQALAKLKARCATVT